MFAVKDDGYYELRKGANDQWNVTKSYYHKVSFTCLHISSTGGLLNKIPTNVYITWSKAAEAYSKGGRTHAAYLSEKVQESGICVNYNLENPLMILRTNE